MYASGWLWWWYVPKGSIYKKTHIRSVLKSTGIDSEFLGKVKHLDAFAYVVEKAKKHFSKSYKIDQVELYAGKRYSYSISACTKRTTHKCKRVSHRHEANISCTESSGNISKTANHPVANYIHTMYEEYKGYIPLTRLTLALRDYIVNNTHSLSVIARGGLWFSPPGDEQPLQRVAQLFEELSACDPSYSISFIVQKQDITKDFFNILYNSLVERLSNDYAKLERTLITPLELQNKSLSEHGLSSALMHVDAIEKNAKKYRELYGVELDQFFEKSKQFREVIVGSFTTDPVQQQNIKRNYGIE